MLNGKRGERLCCGLTLAVVLCLALPAQADDRCRVDESLAQVKAWSALPAGDEAQAIARWIEQGAKRKPDSVEAIAFSDLVPGALAPAGLRLYKLQTRLGMMVFSDVVAVADGGEATRQARVIRGCAAYNALLDRAKVAPPTRRNLVERLQAFLQVAAGAGATSLMRREDEDYPLAQGKPIKRRKDGKDVRGWFARHKDRYRFHGPRIRWDAAKGGSLKFYSWKMIHGVLYAEEIHLDAEGHITRHDSEKLASGLGAFAIH